MSKIMERSLKTQIPKTNSWRFLFHRSFRNVNGSPGDSDGPSDLRTTVFNEGPSHPQ